MNTTLLTIILTILITGIITSLVQIFKDKKISEIEKQELQDIIVETLIQAVEISDIKTEEELKNYAINIIMIKLQENNINNITEKTVKSLIDLILKLNAEIIEKLNKK